MPSTPRITASPSSTNASAPQRLAHSLAPHQKASMNRSCLIRRTLRHQIGWIFRAVDKPFRQIALADRPASVQDLDRVLAVGTRVLCRRLRRSYGHPAIWISLSLLFEYRECLL